MNKLRRLFALIVTISVITASCSKYDEFEDNLGTGIRRNFIVDKIYNYHNILLAEYIYDNNNKLIKRIVADTLIEPNRTIYRKGEDEFQYNNGRVSKIKTYNLYIDNNPIWGFTQENDSETTFEYNSQGKLIKKNGEALNFRYEDGRVVGSSYENDQWIYSDTMVYDNSENIIEHIRIVPELNMVGEPIPGTAMRTVRYYEYDNNPKPNFGLDYLFVYNPLPYTEEPGLIRALSKKNMTKATEDGYAFIYTYNENGLPETIETKWLGIETLEPMLLRITYKQIE
jgi:hypothetical protein